MPMAARRRALLPAALAALVGVVAGCTVGPSDRPPVAVRDAGMPPQQVSTPPFPAPPPQPPPPGRYDPASLPWQDCTSRLAPLLDGMAPPRIECSEFDVAADLAVPALAGSVRLNLTRVGSGQAPLVVLGEAGGEPGTVRAARIATQIPPELLASYTLIGLARRGTGPAQPVDCIPRHTRERIIGADPDARARGELDALLDTASGAIQTCVQELNQLLTAVDSAATADDLEQLRVELDAPVLHVLALGEASRAVADYVDRYPLSAGRVVLDGAPDPTLDDIGAAEASARAAEAGFDAFAADCVDRGCPLAPAPRHALRGLIDTLRMSPLYSPEFRVTAGTALQAVLETVGAPERWPELAAALEAARAGDGTGIAAIVRPLVAGRGDLPARFDPGLATRCNDTPSRVSPVRVEQLVDTWRERFPLFGTLFGQRLLLCSAWPVPSEPPEGGRARLAPPVLVIATAQDPITPAAGTRRTAEQLPSAVLVNWQGHAHGAVGRNPCVTDLVVRYLVDAQVPVEGTLCPP